ncbi:hypothetical protein M942_09370 [Enterobacter ludwigii]|uniref:hypothetical protein n=1 Tax=Enterobacter TaxID=547 RepID=UPI0003D8E532|nr:hypothetical protein [Enterobacter ludwigii]AHE72827.1 hypothetical protein M942_09370 [Enterobacter ludwigii]HDR2587505.1 hypothetical protein [Enterobacter ludwigii]HDR2598949.1 hypothetical protein [Enterobacter ludwigii]
MKKNILNLPHHLRRLRFVHSQRAALAMAGEYHLNELWEIDRKIHPELWFAARAYHDSMIHAISEENLLWHTLWKDTEGNTTRALFLPAVIWPWALSELSDNSLWYGAEDFIDTTQSNVALNDTGLSVNRGRDSQSLVIAGLSRLLVSRTHGAYRYGQKPNISALARDAVNVLADVLPADKDKTETFRKVISESLGSLPVAETRPE